VYNYNVIMKYSGLYSLKMLGCFNPTLGQILTNPNIGLKM